MPNSLRHAGARPRPGRPVHGAPTAANASGSSGPSLPCAGGTTTAPTWEELLGQR